jgi:hypothetical protein
MTMMNQSQFLLTVAFAAMFSHLVQAANVGTSPMSNCTFDMDVPAESFDIVITNGRVMDPECGFDGVRNVGIKGDRIAVITKNEISGGRKISAEGLVVAPGFINTHSHSFAPFEQRIMALDGTTTILDIELGAADVKLFYDKYQNNSLLNFGTGVAHESVRMVVLDGLDAADVSDSTDALKSRALAQADDRAQWALDVPTPEQHAEILRLFEQGMLDGAVSVNSTVGYMGYGVPTYELFDLQKIAKKYDRIFGAHTRFGPTESLPLNYSLGVREVLANAVALDGAVILSHMQNQNWEETYELCQRLQEKDMNIFCEYYPSVYGNPNIATPQLLPDKIKLNNMDPTKTIVNPDTGKNFESEEQFFKMQKEDPGKGVFVLVRDPAWEDQWPYMINTALANDVITYYDKDGNTLPENAPLTGYGGHPRNASTYSWALRQAREKSIPLMEMVNNAGYIPAKYFSRLGLKSMQERGRVQPSMVADLTLLNPDTVKETASMKSGERASQPVGIPYVLVSGEVIVDNGEYQVGARPGKPIRYEPITNREPDLDLQDKKYQWHRDLPDVVNSHRADEPGR